VAASQQVKKSKEGKIPKGFLVPSPKKTGPDGPNTFSPVRATPWANFAVISAQL